MSKQAAICIIHDNTWKDVVYLLRRSPTDPTAPGIYCFPGGKLDEGETPLQACIREVKEETNFDIDPLKTELLGTEQIGDCETFVFRCWGYTGEFALSDEHDAYIRPNITNMYTSTNTVYGEHTYRIMQDYVNKFRCDKKFADKIHPQITSFVIKDVVRDRKHNTYEVRSLFYSGDADFYNTVVSYVPEHRLNDIIERMNDIRRICRNDYLHDEVDTWPKYDQDVYYDGDLIEWPTDQFCDCGYAATLESFEVFYYDSNGDKHKVEIVEQ